MKLTPLTLAVLFAVLYFIKVRSENFCGNPGCRCVNCRCGDNCRANCKDNCKANCGSVENLGCGCGNVKGVFVNNLNRCDSSLGAAPLGNPMNWTRPGNPFLNGMYQ